ncbi:hypothetical protein VP01_2089g1 [Puccinia sorghi]|uniref:Major facilitator superfamily (MFS) profile domain-containing protein n=1 Tax=Puccinia sorghi TaxID=27349 RepID=A0A0L6VAA1_9BASI|nr:hypothetical protein VP01_2089g1 [Puccinia sorghi]
MSSHVSKQPAEEQTPEDPGSPNASESSSKLSSPLTGSPEQIVLSRLLPSTALEHPLSAINYASSRPGLFNEILRNKFVLGCALFASLGGILFGYDQGVISVTLVMHHFNSRFPQIDPAFSGDGVASFWKGFLVGFPFRLIHLFFLKMGIILFMSFYVESCYISLAYGVMTSLTSRPLSSAAPCSSLSDPLLRLASGSCQWHVPCELVIYLSLFSLLSKYLACAYVIFCTDSRRPTLPGGVQHCVWNCGGFLDHVSLLFGAIRRMLSDRVLQVPHNQPDDHHLCSYTTSSYATRLIPSEVSWRLPFGLQLIAHDKQLLDRRIPAVIILLGLALLPSSPSWLASRRRHGQCLETLATLRQLPMDDQSVRQEWIDIRVEADFHHELNRTRFGELPDTTCSLLKIEFLKWADTFSNSCRRRTFVGVGLYFFQQFNIASILKKCALIYCMYARLFFTNLRMTLGAELEEVNMVLLVSCKNLYKTTWQIPRHEWHHEHVSIGGSVDLLSLYRQGRKTAVAIVWECDDDVPISHPNFPSVLFFLFSPAVSVAILIRQYSSDWAHHTSAGWAGVGFLLRKKHPWDLHGCLRKLTSLELFWGSWSSSCRSLRGPVPWAMPSEIFPSSLRAKGVAVSTMSNWINNFIIGLVTPPVEHEGAFFFFAFNSMLSWVFVWFLVPETAYRSLEEMDQVFGDQLAVDDQLMKANILHKILAEEHQ